MSKNQDKKISYQILTAEDLLKEETSPAKEIEQREERIEAPTVQKIESQEKILTKPQEIKEKTEEVQIQKEETKLAEGLGSIKTPVQEFETPISRAIEAPLSYQEPAPSEGKSVEREVAKEEVFYTPQKETQFGEPIQKPLREELEKRKISQPVSETPKKLKLPTNLLRLFLIVGIIALIPLSILFLKPQEKLNVLFKEKEEKREEKREEKVSITMPTPTVILFPTTTPEVTSIPTTVATSIPVNVTGTPTQLQIPFQSEIYTLPEIKFLKNFSSKEIELKNLDFSVWQEEFEKFLSIQEVFGTKINVDFLYNKQKVPYNFLFDYFIKPTKISSDKIEEFKNNLTGSYGFLIYYGYTRKYPVLIFEIKDKNKVQKFNQEWEKLTMRDDLKTLFLGLEPPKTKNNFLTKKQENYSYRILDFGNNFKIIWTVIDNYIIYSASEMGIKDIFSFLP